MTVYATQYNIELRDKNGNLKGYLTPFVSRVEWEWLRLGGCGTASLTINKPYRDLEFEADDDIQIRLKSGATTKLVYRGYIEQPTHHLKMGQQITVRVVGYINKLSKRVVHDAALTKTYENMNVSAIVENIIDTFVTPNTVITKGTIETSSFSADKLDFRTDVKEALKSLSDLLGDVEYGVNENLQFYWLNESTMLRHKFFIGQNVSDFKREFDWSKLVNKIIFQGGKLDDANETVYVQTAEASDSQSSYFVSEAIMANSAITTQSVADQYLGAKLKELSRPEIVLSCTIPNTNLRLEDTLPIGEIAIFDADYDDNTIIVGETADGGSNVTIGLLDDGGSNVYVGAFYSDQITSLQYSMSNTEEKFNLRIAIGDAVVDTAARLKKIELYISYLRER
jgi:hypothetical protein